jgi:hypothetical protein
VALKAPLPEEPDDLNRFVEHLVADVGGRPGLTDHVLVELFAGPESEHEPAFTQQGHGRGRLGDDGSGPK